MQKTPEVHKHKYAVSYEPIAIKGRRRYMVIDYCSECDYKRARDIVENKPNEQQKSLQAQS